MILTLLIKVTVKQRNVLFSLKDKEALGFVPRRLHSPSSGVPSISKPAAQLLPASNPASEVSVATSAASNKPTAINIKAPMSKVEDEEPEEGEMADPSTPHKIQQACSSHVSMPSYFKPDEAHDNESLSGSMAKGIPANPTAAPAKRVLSATAPNANVMEQLKIFTIM